MGTKKKRGKKRVSGGKERPPENNRNLVKSIRGLFDSLTMILSGLRGGRGKRE